MPNPLQEAEAMMRTRTTKATPIEHDLVCQASDKYTFAEGHLAKICKHWGNTKCMTEIKAAMSDLAAQKNFAKGEAAIPGSLEFALSKCLLACSRSPTPEDITQQHAACYCLPPAFYNGCCHGSPPPFTKRMKWDDCMCTTCSSCLRCGRFPGWIDWFLQLVVCN